MLVGHCDLEFKFQLTNAANSKIKLYEQNLSRPEFFQLPSMERTSQLFTNNNLRVYNSYLNPEEKKIFKDLLF